MCIDDIHIMHLERRNKLYTVGFGIVDDLQNYILIDYGRYVLESLFCGRRMEIKLLGLVRCYTWLYVSLSCSS